MNCFYSVRYYHVDRLLSIAKFMEWPSLRAGKREGMGREGRGMRGDERKGGEGGEWVEKNREERGGGQEGGEEDNCCRPMHTQLSPSMGKSSGYKFTRGFGELKPRLNFPTPVRTFYIFSPQAQGSINPSPPVPDSDHNKNA